VIFWMTAARSSLTRATRALTLLSGLLVACSESASSGSDGIGTRLGTSPELPFGRDSAAAVGRARGPTLELLDTHETGLFNLGAAEIVDYHPATRRTFVVNSRAARVSVLELGSRGFRRGERTLEPGRDIPDFNAGRVTSLAVSGDRVAVAVCARSNDRRGRVAFYEVTDLRYLGAVTVGYAPDMLTFTPDGRRVLVANEGEQVRSSARRIVADPEGSVSVIDVSLGVERASVAEARFDGFDARIEEYRNAGVRIPRLGDSYFDSGEGEVKLSSDLEPEYIAVAADGQTAWVSLQENDAVAVLDVAAARFREILPLGVKDFSRGTPSLETRAVRELDAGGPGEWRGMWFNPDESQPGREIFYTLRGNTVQRLQIERGGARVSVAIALANTGERDEFRGLARDRDQTLWVGDAQRSAVYQFAAEGQLLHRFALRGAAQPTAGVAVDCGPGCGESGVLALTLDRERHRLYVLLGDTLTGDVAASPRGRVARIVVVDADVASSGFGARLAEYLYVVGGGRSGAAAQIAGVAIEPSGQLLVLERGDPEATAPSVYRVDLNGASNVLAVAGESFEAQGADELIRNYGIEIARRRKLFGLPSARSMLLRDLALLGDGRMAVGIGSEPGVGHPAALGLLRFDGQNRLDASDRDGAVKLRHWPVLGGYMPDGIEAYRVGGEDYFVTANEGDTREYDVRRLADVVLDPERYPDAAALQAGGSLGRLKISTVDGDVDRDGDFDEIHAFGSRSVSVWDGSGNLIFDTGSLFEEVTAAALSSAFNSNNDENASFDTRSDDKGPEPEGLEIAEIDGRAYAFVGLERVGGIVVLDLTDPLATNFIEYVNPRDFAGSAARGSARDLGPEGLRFVPAAQSPTGRGLLLVANEVSGTTSAYDVNL
jgi:DNA-binding beta-propeller fold protein YncE